MLTLSLALIGDVPSVEAQATADPAVAPATANLPASEATLEKIEITGSLIRRVEGETALPVAVVSRADIARSGASSVEQLMSQLPAFASAQNTTAAQAAGSTTGGLSAISLRGLGSIRTLVLIDGKRAAPYGVVDSTSVDINSIPIAAIERIEILKEGASATYGSDAIAGVVNFILRTNYQGQEATAEYGESTRGGGSTMAATLAYGVGDLVKERYNIMLTASFNKEEELFGRDRAFASKGFLANPLAVLAGYDWTSRNTFPGNITIPGVGRVNPGFPDNCAPSSNDANFVSDPKFSQCRFDVSPYVPLIPAAKRVNLFAAVHYALSDELTAYADLSYNVNRNSQLEQASPVSSQFPLAPGNPLDNTYPYNVDNPPTSRIMLDPSSPFYPCAYVLAATTAAGVPLTGPCSSYPALNVNYRTVYNGGRGLDDNTQTPRLTLGVKGSMAGWDVDAGWVHATNQITEKTTSGYFINSELLPILNSGQINLLYPALGPAPTAAQIARMQATNFNGTAYVNNTGIDDLVFKASRDIAALSGGALALGTGVELRHERFENRPNAYLQVGDLSGYSGNILPVSVSRTMYAAFAELDAPLVKSLEADASVRFDHYEVVGGKLTPKFGLRWQPSHEVLFRASVGKGFRAPALSELYSPTVTGVTPNLTDPADCQGNVGAGCAVQVTQISGGNAKLQPEKSTNVSYGLVLEPTKDVSLAVDFFNIEIKNTIALTGLSPTFIFTHLPTWGGLVTRGPADPLLAGHPGCPCYVASQVDQRAINLGASRVSGFDLDGKWAVSTGRFGRYTLSIQGTYFSKYQTQNPDNSYSDQIDTDAQTLGAGGIIPRWRHRLELDAALENWDAFVAQNHQGSYIQYDGVNSVGSYETIDLNVGYSGFRNLKLNLGVKNVFDHDPPFTGLGGGNWFQSGYDPSYADPRGRFVYLSVGYRFR